MICTNCRNELTGGCHMCNPALQRISPSEWEEAKNRPIREVEIDGERHYLIPVPAKRIENLKVRIESMGH